VEDMHNHHALHENRHHVEHSEKTTEHGRINPNIACVMTSHETVVFSCEVGKHLDPNLPNAN